MLWKAEVEVPGVARKCVEVDEVLAAERPLLADLRYARLLDMARQEDASGVLEVKKGRKRLQSDLELPYHPLLLTILRVRPPHCAAFK